ncbi:MAG: hypothetical protein H3Z51_03535, partial [archaeon]|nr:hypothetical protein [archaeon]
MRIMLVEPDYYTQFPPLGLLKISAYHKSQNDKIIGLVKGADYPSERPNRIYITSLFTWSWRPVWEAVRYYKGWFPDSEVWLGGLYASLLPDHAEQSGADYICKGILKEAEDLLPDYEILELSDRWRSWDGSIIFSTRGCPFECGYCAVPILEGKINSVKYSIKKFVYPKHTRIIFFDNNILAAPNWRSVFDELGELKRRVDFNQGLDARFINDEVAEKLSRLKIDTVIRLAYDHKLVGQFVERAIETLNAYGIRKRRIMVYTLFNYTDDPQDFFERVREILNWGVVTYPMR